MDTDCGSSLSQGRSCDDDDDTVNVRYMVTDVERRSPSTRGLLGFEVLTQCGSGIRRRQARQPPAAAVRAGELCRTGDARRRETRAGRMEPDPLHRGRPGGRGRAPACAPGATFRNDIVSGPGGKQILLLDPSGNVVELFEPANR